ncbi:DUF1624 domain-containing protein [Chthonobacter rhizosphaerae]|uniref:DUF1624 domain-containing protein n=1 Tax=Chthonobacter rhizosphaerae TaxID=2735553 RepID=UPI0015EF927E|nr:heparan-alpha-glucosaminide N-acetyltransferase [Chthonobacter rhizosphaerae]
MRPARQGGRLALVDMARGVAIVAMVVYHVSWDLAYVGFVDWDVARDPVWRGFAITIAATFLVIVGVSLVISDRRGVGARQRVRRVATIAAAAALVSISTYAMFPQAFVFFGILHMIAAGSILALPFVRAPLAVVIGAALLALGLPWVAAGDAFNAPALLPLGLATDVPPSNDYVPIFPWLAPVLAGVAIGRLLPERFGPAEPAAFGAPGRILATLGRWSLVIYLVHQPLLFGLLSGAAALVPPDAGRERARFVGGCEAECGRTQPDRALCTRFCACVADSLDGTGLFETRDGDPADGSLVAAAAGSCRRAVDVPFDSGATE